MSESKAWSKFNVKSVNEEKRTITGIASTITPDRDQDIMHPEGAKFSLPFPFLHQHNHNEPIGHVIDAKTTNSDIEITVQIAKDSGLEYVEDAWKKLKSKLLGGLSIGFRGLKTARIEGTDWGREYFEWDLFEVSAVTVPANAECTITSIKNFDTANTPDHLVERELEVDDSKKTVAAAIARITVATKT